MTKKNKATSVAKRKQSKPLPSNSLPNKAAAEMSMMLARSYAGLDDNGNLSRVKLDFAADAPKVRPSRTARWHTARLRRSDPDSKFATVIILLDRALQEMLIDANRSAAGRGDNRPDLAFTEAAIRASAVIEAVALCQSAAYIAWLGVLFGSACQKLKLLPAEPLAKAGHAVRRWRSEGAPKGGEKNAEKYRKQWPKWQKRINQLVTRPRLYSWACGIVAREFGVHPDTVDERTENPKPTRKKVGGTA